MDAQQTARWKRAHYDFLGVHREVERTLPTASDEVVTDSGAIHISFPPTWAPALGYLRLSNQRLVLLRQHLLRHDSVLEVPPGALTAARVLKRQKIELHVETDQGPQRMRVRGWSRRLRLAAPPLRIGADELAQKLCSWRGRRG